MNMKKMSVGVMVAIGLAVACQAQWAVQRLNDSAVTNELGKIIVLNEGGGVWGGNNPDYAHAVAFDGNTSTFTDLTVNNGQGAWAGFELQEPMHITSIRFFGRENFRNRVRGVQIQGANTSDFSDAETLWTIVAPDAWNPLSWREEQFTTLLPPKLYKFVRFYCPLPNSYGGNIAEMEFYGAGAEDLSVGEETPAPAITFSGCINWRMNLCWTGDPGTAFLYEIERRMAHEANFVPLGLRIAEAGEQHFMDMSVSIYQDAEYRIRAYDYYDVSPWTNVLVYARNAAKGQWLGTQGSWNNGPTTGDKAIDGNVTTYFDGPTDNGCWVGMDFGSAKEIIGLSYVPRRNGDAYRIQKGWFEVADNPDFEDPTMAVVHTVPPDFNVSQPVRGMTNVTLAVPVTARYARYCSPDLGFGNVAEIEFVLTPDTRPPNGLSVSASDLSNQFAVVSWRVSDVCGLVSSVLVYRATSPGGPYTVMTPEGIPPSVTTWTDTSVLPCILYYYKVASLLEAAPDPIEARSDYVTYRPLMRIERDWSDLAHLRSGMVTISTHPAFSSNLDVDKIFDGNATTYADINGANPAIGVNLGKPYEIHFMRFAARDGQTGRINGADLNGSNDPDYTSDYTRLATFAGAVVEQLVTIPTVTQEAFQYIFIQRPNGGDFYGNLTELELYGFDPSVTSNILKAPTSVNLSLQPDGKVDLSWDADTVQDFYRVERSADGVNWSGIGTTQGSTFTDVNPALHQHILYRVVAVRETGPSTEEAAYSDDYPMVAYETGGGTGLTATYFINYTPGYNPSEARAGQFPEPAPDFALAAADPIRADVPDSATNVRIVWTGSLVVPFTGDYTFYVTSPDGAALNINGASVINRWGIRSAAEEQATLHLAKGTYPLRLDYYNGTGDKAMKLAWGGAVTYGVIPGHQLIPDGLPANEDAFVWTDEWQSRWQGRNFGSGRLGFHTANNDGTVTIGHADGDLSGTGENYYFLGQRISGDFILEVKVALDIDPLRPSGKALLMLRSDLANGSPFIAAARMASGLGGFNIKQRIPPNANIMDGLTWTGPSLNPFRLRVKRVKDVVTFAYSDAAPGSLWTPLGDPYENTDTFFGWKVYAGIGVCAPTGTSKAMFQTATFSEVSVKKLNGTVLMVR